MTAFAPKDRASLRRWAISAAIVLLVHGGIAALVVTWRHATAPAERSAPIMVELAPLPPAPTAPPVASAPGAERLARQAERARRGQARRADRGKRRGEVQPAPAQPPEGAAVTVAPSEGTPAASGPDRQGVTSGGANPIDTRIGEPNRNAKKAARAPNNWKKALLARLPKSSGARQPRDAGTAGAMTRNAIGILEPNRAAGLNSADGAKSVIGGGASSAAGNGAPTARTATNAIGVTVPFRPGVAGTSIGQHGTGPVFSSGINGTNMGRPGARTGMIGGAARNATGVIDGTSFRTNHP